MNTIELTADANSFVNSQPVMEMTEGKKGKVVEHLQLIDSTSTSCSMFHTSALELKSTESVWEPHLCCEIFSSGGSDVSEVVGRLSRREDSGSVHSPLSVVWLFSHWVGNRKWWTAPSSLIGLRHTTSSQTSVFTRSHILLLIVETFIKVFFLTLKLKPPEDHHRTHWVKLSHWGMANSSLLLLCPQRAVCHRQAVQREEHGLRVCSQVHQEAAEPGQQARRAKGGGGEGGGHPAADPAPQHRDAARRVREPYRYHPHPGTVSHSVDTWRKQLLKFS